VRALGQIAVAAVLLFGCASMDDTVRTERGPLLRTFDRPRIVEGGVRGQLQVKWPQLTLTLEGYDTCRTEHVEEYAEERIHEHHGAGAGAALSVGVAGTLAGGALLAGSTALSASPDMSVIDGAGNYGTPPRYVMRGWGIGLMCVGVPALVVGIIQLARTGEETETAKVEQIADQQDQVCHARKAEGPVVAVTEKGERLPPMPLQGGVLVLDVAKLPGPLEGFSFYERDVPLDEGSTRLLGAFNGCVVLERENAAEAQALSTGALLKRVEAARECRALKGDAVAAEVSKLEAEVARRREGGDAAAFPAATKQLQSFEQAVSAYPPRWTLEAGSPDLARLDDAQHLAGQNVLIRGRIDAGLSPNIGVVKVGPRDLFVFLPPDAPWGSEDFPVGSSVELVGVASGLQTVGERTAPLVKAVWMRKVSQPRQ
jgi:hypothetical protein